MPQVGFIGLGVIGSRMAGHVLDRGHAVTVWNRTAEKAIALKERGATTASTLADLAPACSPIIVCVSRSEDVEEVIEQAVPHAKPNTLFVDHSTIAPNAARTIANSLEERGHRFLDAPVTGGERGAIDGTLTVFCGGREEDLHIAEPVMGAYARIVRLVGPHGAGQTMKMANQISVALSVLALSECLVFCTKSGLDLAESLELIGSGAGGSWSMTNYGPKVLARDWSPGFSVALQQKDLAYALEAARTAGACLPGTALVHQLFAALESSGRGEDATPALFEVIEGLSGGA
jgi:3-hydroxyisobutyrate dehydrogenase-like beta-hydroxyacid dehydrogenase